MGERITELDDAVAKLDLNFTIFSLAYRICRTRVSLLEK